MKELSLELAQKKLQDSYPYDDFALIEYNGYNKQCIVHCNKCGKNIVFAQYGNILFSSNGKKRLCTCGRMGEKRQRYVAMLKELFPEEQIEILNFTGLKQPITVRCKKCGYEYTIQNASALKNKKYLCQHCYPSRYTDMEKSKRKFIAFITNSDKWSLLDKDISNIHAHDKVRCICKECGAVNEKTIYTYMKGVGCWNCFGHQLKTTEEFKAVLDDEYQLLTEYKGSKEKILLKHTCGFVFSTTPGSYLQQGVRCPKCTRGTSKGEKKIINVLESDNIPFEREYSVNIQGHMLRFDFYLPQQDIYIEFNGIQHYKQDCFNRSQKDFERQVEYDKLKKNWCGEKLLVIPYTDYDIIEEKIHDFLRSND